MKCCSYSFTHPGHIRMTNEDSYFSNDESCLWIVCDGMGGHQEGNFASHLVTDIFEHVVLVGSFDQKIEAINSQFYNIHRILQKKVHKLGNNAVIGTTFILLFIEGENAVSIHSGDSRCYAYRNEKLFMITKDHAKTINGENGKRKALTKALSAPGEFSSEVKKFRIQKNDKFLLCTDGFYENISKLTIEEGLRNKLLQDGIKHVSKEILSGEANDNLTATVIKVE